MGRFVRWSIPILVAGLAILFLQANHSLPHHGRLVWSAKSGTLVPKQFSYVFFPRSATVKLLKSDGSGSGIYLDRAFVTDEEELQGGSTVGVWNGDDEYRIAQTQLTRVPDMPNVDTLVSNWRNVVASWGDKSDYGEMNVAFEKLGNGEFRVKLQRIYKNRNEDLFVYRVKDDTVVPEEWYFSNY